MYCKKDFTTIEVTVLDGGIFHLRIVPQAKLGFQSALSRYDFLEKLKEEECQPEESDEHIVLRYGETELVINKKQLCFSLKKSENTLIVQKSLLFQESGVSAIFEAARDENWAGFGDVARDTLLFRGRSFTCWLTNIKNYISSPFFMSNRGYGILLNTTFPCHFDMAESDAEEFSFKDYSGVLDLFIFVGDNFKDLLIQYTRLTGRVQMIPVWSFGLWHICNTICNARDAAEDALNYRREKIPCDVIGLEPGWMETHYDFTTGKQWNKTRFPVMIDSFKFRRRTFIDAIKYGMGYHFELWLCNDYDLTYEEERRKGLHCKENSSETVVAEEYGDFLNDAIDFDKITKKEEPWFKHLENFVDWGADFFKQDAACQISSHPTRYYGNGMTDKECHNFYCLMYARQMWEGFLNYTGKRPLVFTPVGWTGFQKWATTWTGDTGGGATTLCAMLNCAMLGHTLSTNDMSANTVEGVHFGYLLPLSQINNFSSYKMPWLWGEKFIELHRYYASLRSRLIPYLYSELWETTQTGLPFLRPLLLEFQDDPACNEIVNEYLLGRDLLVTIFGEETFFPKCRWKDYWTGCVFEGSCKMNIPTPSDRGGGLFVREGAIIPLGPVMQYRGERPVDEIELYLFPGPKSTFDYYEDDGVSMDYRKGDYSLSHISLEKSGNTVSLEIHPGNNTAVKRWMIRVACDFKPERITCNEKQIAFEWDEARKELFAELPETGKIIIF